VAETILESLDRLEATAIVIKSLLERVANLEEQFESYADKSSKTLAGLQWADELPDRLSKIEAAAAPLKEGSAELNEKLLKTAEVEESTLNTLGSAIEGLEKSFGVSS
jgi:cell division septum initiation protein DivIVA